MMIGKRALHLLLSFLSYIKVTSPCIIPGLYGLLCDNRCGRCAGNEDCGSITGDCNRGCQPKFFGSKCKMTCPVTCGGDGSCSQFTAFCENGCQSGFTGLQCEQIITSQPPSPAPDAVYVWEPIAVTSLVVTIACIAILVLLYRKRKNNKTKSSYERNLVHVLEENMRYVKLNQLQENTSIRNNSTASFANKDRAGKRCSAIHVEAQRVHANFESDHHDYTVPKFLREESVRDGRSQTDLEPHPYIYVISS